jgi:alcohol dehydrogenase class IV
MISVGSFSVSRLPRIVFGAGTFMQLPDILAGYGERVLIVTGGESLRQSGNWLQLLDGLKSAGLAWEEMKVEGEPSPELVDKSVASFRNKKIDVVLGIGGGSALDAAKAIAGLLPHGNSVLDHLEGVGREIPYVGPATPFIAVPTTAGTGSEATKNAVLGMQGVDGYKKSFRHDALVAQVALVDPDLLATCPPDIIAANGMDALTQLLESFVSARANPFTDALAYSGMQAVREGFFPAWRGGDSNEARQGRERMAYAALLSGITLAQAGLGSVHGLASPLGACFPIPHGVVCGTLVAAATDMNIRVLHRRAPESPALEKYAKVGELLAETPPHNREEAWSTLVRVLNEWTTQLKMPSLAVYDVREEHIRKIVAGSRGSSMKTNPILLTDEEIAQVLRSRL